MPDYIDQIKSRLDVVDVISGYLKVQKSGMNFKARCPFHNEKTPSFYISPERQIWHCFGCSKGGDIFGFVKEIEGVEFPEALRILAAKAGIELERFDPTIKNAKTKLYEVNELATRFFEKQLFQSPTGQKALAYLKERGLTEETVGEFRLGFAPNDWHALGKFLAERGFSEQEIVDAGLVVSKDGRHYDRFRSRITFPITDLHGQVVAFTARVFEVESEKLKVKSETEPGAKYINTPQTLIYDKSSVLYGLSKARTDVRQADRCILVEGNMDALMSWQSGARNVVATSGTALTPNHLRIIQRYTNNLDFCFDADQAGALATRRGIGLALAQKFSVKVVQIPDRECKDPADYVKKHGAGWGQLVAASKPVIDFYFDRATAGYDPQSVENKKAIVAVLAPLVRRLTSRVERAHWVSRLANFLRVKEDAVQADIASARDDLVAYEYEEAKQEPPPIKAVAAERAVLVVDVLSEALLSLAVRDPKLFRDEIKSLDRAFLPSSVAGLFAQLAAANIDSFSWDAFVKDSQLDDPQKLEFIYLKAQELWNGFSEPELKAEFQGIYNKIKRNALAARLSGLEFDIKEAETRRDQERINALAAEFINLTRQLAEVHQRM